MKSHDFYKLKCVKCGTTVDESKEYTSCTRCKGPLEVILDYKLLRERLDMDMLKALPLNAAKYVEFYPIRNKREIVSLHEGGTPLYKCKNLGKKLGMKNLYVKNEGANPTGAFKDRGTMVEITKAMELGKKAVVVASSGNMAASVSAYCANANLPAYILVPQGTPIGKLSQTLAYGARIIQVRSSYDDAAKITRKISEKHNFYLAGDYAYRREGQKSQAYEIIEQMNWEVPDKVIVPIGCGTNGSAIWKGFKEYKMLGLIDKLPKIIGVQAEGVDPVVSAFLKKSDKINTIKNPSTVCSAINVGEPLDGHLILDALKRSKGNAISVKDNIVLESEKILAKTESTFVEPTAAAGLAALLQMIKYGQVEKDDKVLIVLTGAGLKDPIAALNVLYSPPVVEADFEEVEKYLNYGFYDVVATPKDSKKAVIKKRPSLKQLSTILKREFHIKLNKDDLNACNNLLEKFLEKGKLILRGDLQYILEKTIRQSSIRKVRNPMRVIDFEVNATKNEKSLGVARVSYKGKIVEVSANGVGPVDSIINAIKKAVLINGFKFKLTDYEVGISEGGTDASVNVKMTLEDEKKNKIVAMGTSPDIIVASIEAFQEGYNLLAFKNQKN
jgi:threonine synthase